MDSESSELLVLERITGIRFFTSKENPINDDDGELSEPVKEVKKKMKRAKITPEILEKIKQMRTDGKSGREIAKAIGVSEATI